MAIIATRYLASASKRERSGRVLLPIAGLALVCAACEDRPSPARIDSLPRFVDITEFSGLPAAGMTSGAVLVDLDGDGRRTVLGDVAANQILTLAHP